MDHRGIAAYAFAVSVAFFVVYRVTEDDLNPVRTLIGAVAFAGLLVTFASGIMQLVVARQKEREADRIKSAGPPQIH